MGAIILDYTPPALVAAPVVTYVPGPGGILGGPAAATLGTTIRASFTLTELVGAAPSVDTGQIANDLARHAADGWQDILYMYAPQQSGNIDRVQRAMVRLLQDPVVAQAVNAAGMTATAAEKTLLQRFIDGMVSTFDY